MKSTLFDPAKYQQNSPKQLNSLPRVTVRLRRDLGSLSSSCTPIISTAEPRLGSIGDPVVMISSITVWSKSSRVASAKCGYGMLLSVTQLAFGPDNRDEARGGGSGTEVSRRLDQYIPAHHTTQQA